VEHAFRVLQYGFTIIRGSTALGTWLQSNIYYACIISHNMIVEDDRHKYDDNFEYDNVNNDIATQLKYHMVLILI